jgi:uncharacterized damage-inducible protein DinB
MIRETLTQQLECTHQTLRLNLAGLDHEGGLRTPPGGGNPIHWVVGHMVSTRDGLLEQLGGEPVMDARARERYARGSQPIEPGAACERLEELVRLFEESQHRITARLAAVDDAFLAHPVPAGKAEEPLVHQLSVLVFHDAYHAGQLGTLRRAIGMAGAIA